MLKLSYKELEALFRLVHAVPAERTKALFVRFKAFQQLDFPPRADVGRGSRVGYTFDQMLQLLSAFELLEAGAMPLRAARSVASNWPEQRRSYALGWAALRELVSIEDSDLLVSEPLALAEMGGEPDRDGPVADPLRPTARSVIAEWLTSPLVPPVGEALARRSSLTRLVVDPVRLARSVCDYLPEIVAVSVQEVDDAFRAVGVEAFGSALPRSWAAASSRASARGGRADGILPVTR